MDQDKFSLLKSHVEAYTRKDGAVVGAHDTKAQKHPKAIQSAIDSLAPGDDNWQHGDGHSSYPMRIGGNNHMNAMESLHDQGWRQAGGEDDEMKHPDGHKATFKDGAMKLAHGVMAKSHVDAYTKTNGTVVQAHDDKRVAAVPIATHAAALAASSKPGDLDHEDNQIAAGYMKAGDHKSLAGHLKNLDTAARDHILEHVHPEHSEGLGFKKLNMDRSMKQYAEKFPGKAAKPKTSGAAPETKSQNEDWGFHGEAITQHLKDKHGPENYYRNATEQDHKDAKSAASKKFSDAAHKLVQAGHFDKHEQARNYLDATHGRHLHDAAPDGDVAKVPWLAKDVKAFKRKTGSTGA